MSWLIVTPCHNEAQSLPRLADSLAGQNLRIGLWVIVDDGSRDGTSEVARRLSMPFPVRVVSRTNDGGLLGGSAFKAWQFGVDAGLALVPNATWVMKLDADVVLAQDYFSTLHAAMQDAGVLGGVLANPLNREQTLHVPGPVKAYSRSAYEALADLPREIGFDVMDEVTARLAGHRVMVCKEALFDVTRPIGASEGLVHGRSRNGRVCRWVGYWPPYFLLHVLRYAARKPYGIGSVAMIAGYITAGSSPYPQMTRNAYAAEQKQKFRDLIRHPASWLRNAYGIRDPGARRHSDS